MFAIAFTGGILAPTTRDVWRVAGWLMLDGAAASATIAFVGFWVLATSAREVSGIVMRLLTCSKYFLSIAVRRWEPGCRTAL